VSTINDLTPLRDRLYESYVSQHAGRSTGEATRLAYQRSIRPLLPPRAAGPVVDIGCGAGQLVRCLLDDGYEASGVDISPEQVAEAQQDGLDVVSHGDYLKILQDHPGQFAAVTATDLLEHLTKPEVLTTFDAVATALRPGGRFIARVPNAVSPFGGFYRYGDFTHENWFTAASVRQLAAAAGLGAVTVTGCPPPAHGLVSAARVAVWRPISGLFKLALAAETGVLRGHIVTQNLMFAATAPTREGA
jgi:2-polyprenyl-3-methyl-5-hydroxy-6-metoxy-1,4-benzoquinol methylase